MIAASSVPQNGEHPVQGVQDPNGPDGNDGARSLADAKWDDIKVFLNVGSELSLRAAAVKSGVSVNTVRTRIARLEEHVGEPLLVRGYDGVRLTPSGMNLQRAALGMRGAAVTGQGGYSNLLKRPGELRIGASEGLGSGWLTPRLLELQEHYPSLTMTMLCDNDLVADHSRDLDIEIVWQLPRDPSLIAAKLATLHFMPFASRDYVARHGVPREPEDLLNHRFIEQASPGVRSDLLDQLVGSERPTGFVPIRTNSSLAVFWAVANGAGIAFMPTYACVLVDKLVPIDLPFRLKFDIFYYYHAEAKGCEVVRSGVNWLKGCFDPALYPWFRSNFVHPGEFFPKQNDNVVPLFQTLV